MSFVQVRTVARQTQTAAIARRHDASVLGMAPEAFTFGGALNLGTGAASGEVLVALSAHACPADDGWLERLVGEVSDPRVACASGERYLPDGSRLTGRVEQDIALARQHPTWGYSSGAGAFRAELWRRRAFREDLPACEDKEWALHWLDQGYVSVLPPSLLVDHDHTHDPLPRICRRARREAAGIRDVPRAPSVRSARARAGVVALRAVVSLGGQGPAQPPARGEAAGAYAGRRARKL